MLDAKRAARRPFGRQSPAACPDWRSRVEGSSRSPREDEVHALLCRCWVENTLLNLEWIFFIIWYIYQNATLDCNVSQRCKQFKTGIKSFTNIIFGYLFLRCFVNNAVALFYNFN